MRKINKIKLFINDNEKSKIVAKDLELELKKYDFKIVSRNYDLAISIGGDGSFLRMVKDTKFNEDIYYIGINSGTLGFLQEIDIDKCADFVKRLNSDNYKIEEIGKEAYMTDKLMKLSNEALLIKLADILYNISDNPTEAQEIRMFKNLKAMIIGRLDITDNVKHLAMLAFSVWQRVLRVKFSQVRGILWLQMKLLVLQNKLLNWNRPSLQGKTG